MCPVEYGYLAEELQGLVGKRFSKISKLENGYRLRIGDADVMCQPPIRLHITKYIEESEEADSLVEKIRKEVKGARLEGVSQINSDRVIMLDFGECRLYFEMFAKGNIILVKEGKTIAALRYEHWADREIKPNMEYKTPKPPPTKISDILSDKYIIVALLKFPLGREYVEELLLRADINEKIPGNRLSEKQIEKLENELDKMRKEFSPYVFYDGGKPIAFGLIKFSKYSNLEKREFRTLSEAADEYYLANQMPMEDKKVEKLKLRLAKQEEYLEELKKEEKEYKEKGDFVYANYEEIEKILRIASSSGMGEIEGKLSRYKAKLNKKEKSIEVDIQ